MEEIPICFRGFFVFLERQVYMSCDESFRRHLHNRLTHKHGIKKGDRLHHPGHDGDGHYEHTHEELEHEHLIESGDDHHYHDHIAIELSSRTAKESQEADELSNELAKKFKKEKSDQYDDK